ncbi:phosphoglycolate phosphatase [Pelagibius sp.]|uniref:phosphoglycolate phosphatase n=1 Tax=Pelagibius sp. TaxID=1931238 RepID=UPI00261F7D9D|nr:phosphoglycolate phosphatase [Pelagibius sp.]
MKRGSEMPDDPTTLRIEAVIFDLDGTLVDSLPDIHAAANRLLGERGHGPLAPAEVRGFVGNGMGVLVERLLAAAGEAAGPDDLAAAQARYGDLYDAAPSERSSLYPGVRAALERLQGRGLALGVCTNKPETPARQILADLGIAGCLPVLVGGDSLPQRKPDPAPLYHAAAGLDVATDAVLYVGDSEVDAATAQAAGVRFALHTEGYRKTPVAKIHHDLRFEEFARLPALVDALSHGRLSREAARESAAD